MSLFLEAFWAFLATVSFSIMFSTPKKELLYCGIAGAFGWFIYALCTRIGLSSVFSNFWGTVFIAYFSRLFAIVRKNPISVFLTSGIITLVPGAGIYNTMLHIVMSDNKMASHYGVETVKIACAIAFGIIVILALPQFMFTFKIKEKSNNNS
ncbi:threonine/serine exporter family protein [uncultured Tyzzerella sp.]|uniref:threonine/serine exporter family protein n=1 Tax=uncultured Tyzzerella sp. TaxID=2321398 RepID=UPI0029431CD5|nr:threonine/serine exporter family protein [uncultured Tyzzerella sp.]